MKLQVFMDAIEREQENLDKRQQEALKNDRPHAAAAYTGAMLALVALSKAIVESNS